jgi:hypothetical protein
LVLAFLFCSSPELYLLFRLLEPRSPLLHALMLPQSLVRSDARIN